MTKRLRELTTELLFTVRLVRARKPRRRVISCQAGGAKWYQYGSLRLPHCLNRLWRWLARR